MISFFDEARMNDNSVPEDQIKDIKADMTLVGGKVVFQR